MQAVMNHGTNEELFAQIDKRYGTLEEGKLEDIIDESNIHGWLQQRIALVEYRLAYVVTLVTEEDAEKINVMKDAAYEFGKTHAAPGGINPKEAYQLLEDVLVNGMPCDRVNNVIDETDNTLTWVQTTEIHKQYWDMLHGNMEYYYAIRESLIKGILENSGVTFVQVADATYELRKGAGQYGIDLLVDEHKNILKLTGLLRTLSGNLIDGAKVDVSLFRECIAFARNYADKHHHGKEEKILFRVMLEKLGPVAEKLIRSGMLVEHDLGRYHMGELEAALLRYEEDPSTENKLDIITNASGYANLLRRHIEKEDTTVYPFALRALSEEDKKLVDEETVQFEQEARDNGIQDKYISWLSEKLK
jgi:hemerythrin-like domain-containing protein